MIKPTAFKEKPDDKEIAQIHGSRDQKICWPWIFPHGGDYSCFNCML